MNSSVSTPAEPARGQVRTAQPAQLSWLHREAADWQSEGIITADQVAAITGRYRPAAPEGARVSMCRILLWLGGVFVCIGLIWLVAANLDALSPAVRFGVVVVLWLMALAGSEALAARRASRALVGAIRLLAALAFGAVVFQAAQSLQVPAFEPVLVGVWAAGTLLHGYLTRSTMPFVVGVVNGLFWWIAQPMWVDASGLGVVVTLGAGAVLAASLAVLHDRWQRAYAWWWRLLAGALALVTMFAAAVPGVGGDEIAWSGWLVAELVAAGVAAALTVGAAVTGHLGAVRWGWLEPTGAAGVLVVGLALAMWDTGTDTTDVTTSDWAHAVLSVLAYVGLAIAVVALDTIRGHALLTWLAMGALVVFTTFQSFAVFAPIITGAWLFVVLGTIFLGTGLLFDRARRELTEALADAPTTQTGEGR